MTLYNSTPHDLTMGTLFILTAPSGAGKTTLAKALAQSLVDMTISVSYTTRPQRPGEENGVHYWFVDVAEFKAMVAREAFLEYAEVFNHCYGTSREQVGQYLSAGKDVILAIDWQGATQVQTLFSDAVSIFILPPSADLLRHRLEGRQQDQEAIIEQRLAGASGEVSHHADFDYIIVNDDLQTALADLQAIVRSHHLRQSKQAVKYQGLLAELLKKM
jgi:guanylate kinase